MKSIIFANFFARDTSKFSKTLRIESSKIRFCGNFELWDCGGQDGYIDYNIENDREYVFSKVFILIFVFDIKSTNLESDVETYKKCIESLHQFSPNSKIFVLMHKMDLIQKDQRENLYQQRIERLREISLPFIITCFQTSIWEETLYKAWSRIVYSLIPNAEIIKQHLNQFMTITEAEEVVLFEKATFLDISHTTQERSEEIYKDGQRFERISNIIKMFKLSCMKSGTALQSMRIHNSNFDAYIYEFTSNTYIMVVVSDPEVLTTATLLNIQNARAHFELLLKNTIS